eukprot:PhM_4_TR4508/c1_g2_i1/m.7742/K00002/AKR1A1, adh; alcohol dehydrogenase (NADP+)
MMATVTLNNGVVMPLFGLGTWNSKPGEVKAAVLAAIECGYRHIDCAAIYKNETEVGEALTQAFSSGLVKREDLWVTSKLWNSFHARHEVPERLAKTLSDLQLEYLDLYLVHWPVNTVKDGFTPVPNDVPQPTLEETWQGMIDVYEKKLTRCIGVSNFSETKLKVIENLSVVPAVNQCELHPYNRQDGLLAYCASKGIHLTAYSPLGTPDVAADQPLPTLLQNDVVKAVAAKYEGATPAHVLIAWAMQRGTSVIPKSVTPERIKSNLEGSKLRLSDEDMKALSSFEAQHRYVAPDVFCSENAWYKTPAELFA